MVARNAWCGPAKWYLQWYARLEETLCAFRPDIIDLWEEPWSLLSAQVSLLKQRRLPQCRLISETEQNIAKVLPPPFEWFRSLTFKAADYLVARNTEALSVARDKGYTGPAGVVGNGVDTRLFRQMDRSECRRQMGVDGFVVGYAGRLVKEKGLRTLLAAVGQMQGHVCLLLSGDGPLRAELCREPFVKWVGAITRESLPVFYNALDTLVLPSLTTASWKEQFGRVIVEAQCCGIPVVGSNSGAIPEVIAEAGLVFAEGDETALRNALDKLRSDPEFSRQQAEGGRVQAAQRYSWEAIAKQMRGIYLNAV
jgi:glycosyltransferase involved in cell wall biosynthesis